MGGIDSLEKKRKILKESASPFDVSLMSPCPDNVEDLLPTRKTLVGRLANLEDNQSWRDFFETYWKLIYAFAIKSGCSDAEAEEVVQETVISVARKMPDFQYKPEVCSFKGWLMHVANWRVIDQLRRRRHERVEPPAELEDTGTGFLESIPDPLTPEIERLWDGEWRRNMMDAAIDRVKRRCNPQHYQVFYLATIKKLDLDEIVKTLGVSRAQIYLAKHRVAALVRKEMKYLETKMV
jgi:RNA polymerase sigma factor (sigma-70 family)